MSLTNNALLEQIVVNTTVGGGGASNVTVSNFPLNQEVTVSNQIGTTNNQTFSTYYGNVSNLSNMNDSVDFEPIPYGVSGGVFICETNSVISENVFFNITGTNTNTGEQISIKYEFSYHSDTVNNKTIYILEFNIYNSDKITITLKENTSNGGFNDLKMIASSNDVTINNNIVQRETNQIDIGDIAVKYTQHQFLQKDYLDDSYLKSIAAVLLPNSDTTIPELLRQVINGVNNPVTVGNFPSSQTVNGTVTSNITGIVPLPTNASTDRILATSPFSNRLSDGINFYDARSNAASVDSTHTSVVTINTDLASIDCSDCAQLFVRITGTFTGTISILGDNNSDFLASYPINALNASTLGFVTTVSVTNTNLIIPVRSK
jgi:hypothetical protein